ncbi:MAG: type VI secretion system tip protein VgrG [Myxococcales bacterium]|nr:type VI secretion system tip protein VgrG [Myxococcales bacterium]
MRVHPRGGSSSEIEWVVLGLVLEEALHESYRLEVAALTHGEGPEIDALLRARVDVEIVRGEDVRVVHGMALRVELMGDLGDGARFGLRIGPAVELAGLGRRSRVFQGRSVVEIAEAVLGPCLADHGSALHVGRLVGSYAPRDYCVQYRESDLDFVRRILADEGIVMLFDHGGDTEVVVLVDDNQALPAAGCEPLGEAGSVAPALPYVPEREGEVPVESIQMVTQGQRLNRGRWKASVWAWNERPPAMSSTALADEESRSYDAWQEADEGRSSEGLDGNEPVHDASPTRARLQRRRDETRGFRLWGQTNATVLRAGSVFELVGSPHDEFGTSWVVTRARLEGAVPAASVYGSSTNASAELRGKIECQPHAVPVVVERRPRPIVQGVHTAVVTGPPGESIHTDRFGRVRVRMLWDEQAHGGEETSCWLRVAQPWAGDGFGTVFIPRVGTEVLVSFVDGDPDRPLCTGSVYDGGNLPPYALPEHKTRTVLRTASVDGDGYNELSFEDAAGQEEIFLHAQRNLRETIRAGRTTSVGDCQRTWIGGARTSAVSKDDLLQVAGNQTRTVDGDVSDRIRGAMRIRVSEAPKDPTGPTGLGIAVEQGAVDIEAKEAIVLRCGASRLELHPNKVVLSSPEIVAQCPSQTATHPTSIALTTGAVEVTTDALRQRAIEASIEVDRRVVLGVGPELGMTSLRLDEGATLRTCNDAELRAKTLVAAGTEKTTMSGTVCELAGEVVSIDAKRVGIDADHRIEIGTPGQVNVRGQEKITLN